MQRKKWISLASVLLTITLAGTAAGKGAVTDVLGGADSTILGPTASAGLGMPVLIADIDGDGSDDLLLDDQQGVHGRVLVFFSRPEWPATLDLGTTAADVTILAPDQDDDLRLVAAGDLDGDGAEELVLLSTTADGPGNIRPAVGEVHVLKSRASWPEVIDLGSEPPDVLVYGGAGSMIRTAAAADLNGDAVDDLLLLTADAPEVRSRLMLLYGRSVWPPTVDLEAMPPDAQILLPACYGTDSRVRAGDVTGDGLAEIFVCGCDFDPFHGPAGMMPGRDPWPEVLDRFEDGPEILLPGWSISFASVVGDPTGDLLVNVDEYGRGTVKVFEGGPGLVAAVTANVPAVTIHGRDDGDALHARCRRSGGDLDGDGEEDLLLSSLGDTGRDRHHEAGEIAVLRGPLAGGTIDLAVTDPDLLVLGGGAGSLLLQAAVGDLDDDGIPDLVTGAHGDDRAGEDAGAVVLFLAPEWEAPGPAERFVDANSGDDLADGTGWATAMRTIQAALDSIDGTRGAATVHVAEGTYEETISPGAATTLLGGYPSGGGERNPSERPSILDGGGEGPVVTILPHPEADAPATLDGFVVTGGRSGRGAGVLVLSSTGISGARVNRATVRNNVIRWNETMRTVETEPCPGDPMRVRCREDCGAGVAIHVEWFAEPSLWNNLVHSNLFLEGADRCADLPTCEVRSCEEPEGAVYAMVSITGSLDMRSNTVARNSGPGLVAASGPRVSITDNIFYSNEGTDLVLDGPPADSARYNLVGTSNVALGPSNRRSDPLFLNGPAMDFRLRQVAAGQGQDSPGVDAGSVLASQACGLSPQRPCMDGYSTRTDQVRDEGALDLGHHAWTGNQAPRFGGLEEVVPVDDCALALSWGRASDLEGDTPIRYLVYRAGSSGAHDFSSPFAEIEEPALGWVDREASWGSRWHYVVRAEDAGGRTDGNCREVFGWALDGTSPEVDRPAAGEVNGCRVSVAFHARDDCSGVSLLELHRSLEPDFIPLPSTLVASAPASPHSDSVPENGNWYYRLVALDAAGRSTTSAPAGARVDGCAGPAPSPGEARIEGVWRAPSGLGFRVGEAEGADFHRLLRGDLATLGAGYSHGADVGPDGDQGTGDDTGICRIVSEEVVDHGAMAAGSFYYLLVGMNDSGPGSPGLDSSHTQARVETSGPANCP